MNLSDAILKAAKLVYDEEKISLPLLSQKLEQVREACPYDNTVNGMCAVITKQASRQPFISRRDLKDLYNKFYTQNNKFGIYFKEELGLTEQAAPRPNIAPHKELKIEANPVLVHELESLFNKEKVATLAPSLLKQAANHCGIELQTHGVPPQKVEAKAGNEEMIICEATYDSPRGEIYMYLPVEMNKSKVLFPSCFLNKNAFSKISSQNLKDYLVFNAGLNTYQDSKKILNQITAMLNPPEEADETVQAILRVALNGASAGDPNGIIGQNIMPEIQETPVPTVNIPEEISSIASQWSSPMGEAEFRHGNAAKDGLKMVAGILKQFGHSAQVGVLDSTDKNISYGIKIGNKSLTIPVTVKKGKLDLPSFIVANGQLFDFDSNGVSDALSEAGFDAEASAKISSNYMVKSAELIEIVKTAMERNHHEKAEDALFVLQSRGGEAYQLGLAMYQAGLRGDLHKAASVSKCSRQVKSANSQHTLCGHTMLPLHKVYQDEYGDCRPMYRKYASTDYEGAMFITSKALLG